jgi:hypothetical protein
MKKYYIKIFIFHVCILHCFSESGMKDVSCLYELEHLIGKIEVFKSIHSRFPTSLDEMITEASTNYDITGFLEICRRSGFNVSYLLSSEDEILVKIKEKSWTYECRNDGRRFCFFKDGTLIREYSRDNSGNIINEKSYAFEYPFEDILFK